MPGKLDERRLPVKQLELARGTSPVGMARTSYSLFYSASLLKEAAVRQNSGPPGAIKHSHFALAYFILWHAILDAYFNETLALSEWLSKDKGNVSDEILSEIRRLIRRSMNEEKIRNLFRLYARPLSDDLIDDISLLFELRDIIYHLEHQMVPTDEYPRAAHVFLERIKTPKINTDWITQISTLDAMSWVEERCRTLIEAFCADGTGTNPFMSDDPRNWPARWESMRRQIFAPAE